MTFNAYNTWPLISAIILLFFGLFVFIKNKKSGLNVFFFLICFSTLFWQLSFFVLFTLKTPYYADLAARLCFAGITFLPVTFYNFVIEFTCRNKDGLFLKKIDKIFLFIFYISTVFFEIMLFSGNYYIAGYNSYYFGYYPKAGVLHPVFVSLVFLSIVRMIILLINGIKDKELSRYKRYQFKYFLGALFFYIFSSLDFLGNYGLALYTCGFLFIIIFIGIIVYTIISFRLMDIKFVLRQSVVYIISLTVTILMIYFAKYFIGRYFIGVKYLLDIFFLILASLTFPLIKNKSYLVANKFFFTSLYDSKKVISALSERLSTTLDAKKIFEEVDLVLTKAFHSKGIAIFYYNEETGLFDTRYCSNIDLKKKSVKISRHVLKHYLSKPTIFTLDDLKAEDDSRYFLFIKEYGEKLGMEIFAPMVLKDKIIGFIALTEKESGDSYNSEDVELLTVIASQVGISLENSVLYEETKSFNIKLTKEIEKATHDLRVANEELKKLDEAKSEFISIASHQLRTPLTVIKGYSSMMLEGSFGKLEPIINDNIQKIYESSQRLTTLVEDLLNISRIESGRLVFDFKVESLYPVVASVVEELAGTAKSKNIYLNLEPLAKDLPNVKIDKNKIRQVIINIIDNSIKYTPTGGVTVKVFEVGNFVRVSVADTGMGINPYLMEHLFQKFTRGEETSVIHTEGTGLGLYVGKMMIEEHGGRIWAESAGEGKGSVFSFELPIVKEIK